MPTKETKQTKEVPTGPAVGRVVKKSGPGGPLTIPAGMRIYARVLKIGRGGQNCLESAFPKPSRRLPSVFPMNPKMGGASVAVRGLVGRMATGKWLHKGRMADLLKGAVDC